jgi:cytosine deaminase
MPLTDLDRHYLVAAREQAELGAAEGGVPVGAALVADGRLLGVGRNRRVQEGSAIRHGETDAVERAGRQLAATYRRATLYTTLSPCDLCTGLVLLYGIPRLVVGEDRSFRGPQQLLEDRGVEVVVADDPACTALMSRFIAERPDIWYEDIGEPPGDTR